MQYIISFWNDWLYHSNLLTMEKQACKLRRRKKEQKKNWNLFYMAVEWVYALCNRLLSHFASGLLSFAVQASIALLFPWATFSFPFLSKYCYQFRCCWLVDAMRCIAIPNHLGSVRNKRMGVDIFHYLDFQLLYLQEFDCLHSVIFFLHSLVYILQKSIK